MGRVDVMGYSHYLHRTISVGICGAVSLASTILTSRIFLAKSITREKNGVRAGHHCVTHSIAATRWVSVR